MTARYVLALQAAFDLFEIWDYIKERERLPLRMNASDSGMTISPLTA
jgi:hypothetical protein